MLGKSFVFGPFVLNSEAGTLLRHGVPVPVGYRALRLLRDFLDKPGKILTKSDLIDAAWEGAAVEEGNLSVQIASLRKLLGPMPDGADWITTIPRVGYRFAGPIESQSEEAGGVGKAPNELGNGPSIAVLPFINLSDNSDQSYFADGLTEDIITRLARLRWLFVASRNSSFAYKGMKVEPGQVGRDLRVRYILEGSVRRSENRLRIVSQLSEALSGVQVWADTNEVELAEFFALQDLISERVIAAIEPRLYAAEHQRFQTRPPESLDAWGYVMKAMPHVWTWGSIDEISRAQELLAKAIRIDPKYSRANSLLGWTIAAKAHLGLADSMDDIPKAMAMTSQAIQDDPEDPWSHFATSYVHMVARNFDAAIEALNEAIALNPSLAIAHLFMGSTYAYGGFPDDGLHYLALAQRMSPRDFTQSAIYSTSGLCHFMAGRYDQSIALQRRAVQLRPHFGTAWRTLVASAGMAGDIDTGRQALVECLRLQPSLSLEWVEKYHPIVRKSDREKYLEGLRAVGLT